MRQVSSPLDADRIITAFLREPVTKPRRDDAAAGHAKKLKPQKTAGQSVIEADASRVSDIESPTSAENEERSTPSFEIDDSLLLLAECNFFTLPATGNVRISDDFSLTAFNCQDVHAIKITYKSKCEDQ